MNWLEHHAGPLLLLPEALLSEWSGIDVPPYREVVATFRWNEEEPRASDYDRACDIDDHAGVIAVGYGEGLVLGDAPEATAWIERSFGGILARWEYAESEESMAGALANLPLELNWEPKGTFTVLGSPLQLFNSAEPGDKSVLPRLSVDLAPGDYEVAWTRYAPNEHTAVKLIALRRAASPHP